MEHAEEPDARGAQPVTAGKAPSLWRLFGVWLALGAQSFGGGTATLFLIRRAAVERYHWLSDEEFTRYWSLCLVAPGINLLGLTILLGRHVGGYGGVFVALSGLMLPSVTITILMIALYAGLQDTPIVQAALRGIVPVTIGLGLLTASNMARPMLAAGRREGRLSLGICILLLLGSAAAMALLSPPVIAVLCAAGAVGACFGWWRAARAGRRD